MVRVICFVRLRGESERRSGWGDDCRDDSRGGSTGTCAEDEDWEDVEVRERIIDLEGMAAVSKY